MDYNLFWFWFFQFVNVILGTMRSILTVRANAHTAALINAASFTLYNITVKMLTGYDMAMVIVSTFATNMIGVYIGKWIGEKMIKDRKWKYTIEAPDRRQLEKVYESLHRLDNDIIYIGENILKMVSDTQVTSKAITEICKKYKCAYYAIEIKEISK